MRTDIYSGIVRSSLRWHAFLVNCVIYYKRLTESDFWRDVIVLSRWRPLRHSTSTRRSLLHVQQRVPDPFYAYLRPCWRLSTLRINLYVGGLQSKRQTDVPVIPWELFRMRKWIFPIVWWLIIAGRCLAGCGFGHSVLIAAGAAGARSSSTL